MVVAYLRFLQYSLNSGGRVLASTAYPARIVIVKNHYQPKEYTMVLRCNVLANVNVYQASSGIHSRIAR